MARIEVPMSPAAQRGSAWEGASAKSSGPIHFPEGGSSKHQPAASRTAPIASAGPDHLGPQFGGNKALAGLHANLSKAGYANGPSNKPANPMEAYRSTLRQVALSTAGSSNHSLGHALNADPSMFGGPHQAVISKSSGGKVRGLLGRLGRNKSPGKTAGKSSGAEKKLKIPRSVHEGKNAAHLKAVTGSKV